MHVFLFAQATDKMFEHMKKPNWRPADFLVVGPLGEDSKIVTGNGVHHIEVSSVYAAMICMMIIIELSVSCKPRVCE